MTVVSQRAIQEFIERWKNRGDEKSDTQKFWLDFLRDVCGVERPSEIIEQKRKDAFMEA